MSEQPSDRLPSSSGLVGLMLRLFRCRFVANDAASENVCSAMVSSCKAKGELKQLWYRSSMLLLSQVERYRASSEALNVHYAFKRSCRYCTAFAGVDGSRPRRACLMSSRSCDLDTSHCNAFEVPLHMMSSAACEHRVHCEQASSKPFSRLRQSRCTDC